MQAEDLLLSKLYEKLGIDVKTAADSLKKSLGSLSSKLEASNLKKNLLDDFDFYMSDLNDEDVNTLCESDISKSKKLKKRSLTFLFLEHFRFKNIDQQAQEGG